MEVPPVKWQKVLNQQNLFSVLKLRVQFHRSDCSYKTLGPAIVDDIEILKPYTCPKCTRRFANAGSCQQHIYSHEISEMNKMHEKNIVKAESWK